jgi:NAD(P)-dependent dehydrogenase (short-subunit alcohol dehydrogenase family)
LASADRITYMLLKGKKAIITGGSRGIGKAIAAAFLREGAEVMIAARSSEELAGAQKELETIAKGVHTHPVDVSSEGDARALVAAAVKEMGGVDILVNAAGIYGPIGPSSVVGVEKWRNTFEVNLFGAFYMFREVAPLMAKTGKGKIINFSGGGDGPLPNFSAYNSSKAAIVRLTETLAEEVKQYHIDVNAIAPGPVNTQILEDALAAGEKATRKEFYEKLVAQKKEGGVPPEKAAELCVFLASSASDGLTGKFLSAVWDDYKHWDKAKIVEIMKSDKFTLRRVK